MTSRCAAAQARCEASGSAPNRRVAAIRRAVSWEWLTSAGVSDRPTRARALAAASARHDESSTAFPRNESYRVIGLLRKAKRWTALRLSTHRTKP